MNSYPTLNIVPDSGKPKGERPGGEMSFFIKVALAVGIAGLLRFGLADRNPTPTQSLTTEASKAVSTGINYPDSFGNRHVVKTGESLWDIANHYGTTTAEIRRLNDLAAGARIVVGQTLAVPQVVKTQPRDVSSSRVAGYLSAPKWPSALTPPKSAITTAGTDQTAADLAARLRLGATLEQRLREIQQKAPPPIVAENGSYYGQLNQNGVPKTVYVQGYYRADGAYVRSHFRSPPYSNSTAGATQAVPPTGPGVAENGSYYGQPSQLTGRPKTVYVNGYYRKDGTYVRGHYRSKR